MPPSPVEELALLDLDRSNKGASKQRRDQINAEIARMRDLLPLPETARQRLSQLQIMSLSCVYIRKCNVLQKLFRSVPSDKDVPTTCDFFQALTGFLLITTREGKLVYISENVTDYLGHSMVDMKTQGDSLYDIVDKRDHGTVQAQLLQGGADMDVTRDVAFFCRMNMSRTLKRQAGFGDVKVMHVRGHFIPLSDPDAETTSNDQQQQQQQQQKYVFMATCSPLITPELKENLIQSNTMVFKTVHQLNMAFLEVTKTAEYHLGYTTDEICQKSWYSMLHPEDIHEAREKHILLIRSSHEMGCMMTVRMLNAEGHVLWVNIVMHVRQAAGATPSHTDDPLIVCTNQIISEEEAYQMKLQSHMFTLYPPRSGELWAAGLQGAPHAPTHAPSEPSRWMPPAPGMSPPSAPGNYQTPVTPYYVQQRPPMPACAVNYPTPAPDRAGGYQIASTSPTSLQPQVQSDKLKIMLKRKIQGPCRPAKVPKLAWDEHADGNGHNGGMGFEYAATGDPMHSPTSASQFLASSTTGSFGSWSPGAQVVPLVQYRVAHVLPASLHQQHKMAARLISPLCPAALSPPLSVSQPEQVVPESIVAVPDSYLTPDPSPASSPQPHSNTKTEVAESKTVTSAAILQKLEKLASLSHTHTATSTCTTPDTAMPFVIKREKMDSAACGQTCRQRELPIMDAFDIESFFDTLGCSDAMTPVDLKERHQAAIKRNVACVKPTLTLVKQEPILAQPTHPNSQVPEQCPKVGQTSPSLPSTQAPSQVPAHASMPKKRPQPEMDAEELEELFSFFSGDMTATQLDLADGLTSSDAGMAKGRSEGEALVESVKAFSNGLQQDNVSCGAGHLGAFLLHTASIERPPEDFSPVSASDVNSDLSGDEESNCSEDLAGEFLMLPCQPIKREGGDRRGQAPPLYPGSRRTHALTHTPQDVPGLTEEDELYQLDKLLSSISPDDGFMSEETQ